MGNYVHIQSYKELKVYNNAVKTAMEVFDTSRRFPPEEWKSLGEPMRLAARGVAAAIAQAWERRRFKTPFVAKLCAAQSEAAALQVWMDIAYRCGYIKLEDKMNLDDQCGLIMAQLHRMINTAQSWLIRPSVPKKEPAAETKKEAAAKEPQAAVQTPKAAATSAASKSKIGGAESGQTGGRARKPSRNQAGDHLSAPRMSATSRAGSQGGTLSPEVSHDGDGSEKKTLPIKSAGKTKSPADAGAKGENGGPLNERGPAQRKKSGKPGPPQEEARA
jgi:four helix bundle protein